MLRDVFFASVFLAYMEPKRFFAFARKNSPVQPLSWRKPHLRNHTFNSGRSVLWKAVATSLFNHSVEVDHAHCEHEVHILHEQVGVVESAPAPDAAGGRRAPIVATPPGGREVVSAIRKEGGRWYPQLKFGRILPIFDAVTCRGLTHHKECGFLMTVINHIPSFWRTYIEVLASQRHKTGRKNNSPWGKEYNCAKAPL